MAEKKLLEIKAIYRQLKGYVEETPRRLSEVQSEIAEDVNDLIDDLSTVSETDYSRYQTDATWTPSRHRQYYKYDVFRARTNALVERLKSEYSFDSQIERIQSPPTPAIAIFNENRNANTIDIKINFTVKDLIEAAQTEEEKENLKIIDEELKKPSANWDKVKIALSWIINYSKDLSLKVIPIVLDYYLKKGT